MSWPESKTKSPPRRLSTTAPVTPGAHTIGPSRISEVLEQRVAAVLGGRDHERYCSLPSASPYGPAMPLCSSSSTAPATERG